MSPSSEIRQGVRHLAKDIVTLVELQAELLEVDMKEFVRSSLMPLLILGTLAIVLMLASIPVLLFSIAYFLVEYAEWPQSVALLAAAGIGILLAAICAFVAWRRGKRGKSTFSRFRFELARNVRWLKQVLSNPISTVDR
jgi:uncharacterized membrane protein YqjE